MHDFLRRLLCCFKPVHIDIDVTKESPCGSDAVYSPFDKPLPALPSTPPSDHAPIRKGLGIAKGALFVADGLSKAFPPLEAAVDILKKAVNITEQYLDNEDGMKGIQERIGQIEQDLRRFRRPDGTELRGQPQPQDQPRKFLENTLKNVLESIERTKSSNLAKKAVKGESIAAKIQTYLDEVEQALDRYHFSLTQDVRDAQMEQDDLYRLDKLRAVTIPSAVFRRELPGCLKGTRIGILEELRQWASDRKGPQVFWLNGHAGSGKSTIAQSFAELLSSQGELGASFFCSRKLRDRNSAERILPTLSHQLCAASSPFREALLRELKANEAFATSVSLTVQLEHLVIIPATHLKTSTVMLIDALDECIDKQSLSILLSYLVRDIARAPSLKLFIASRAELHIKRSLLSSPSMPDIKIQEMHRVDGVEDDVRLFIETELGRTATERLDVAIPSGWPEKDKTDVLVSRAGGLFIFASTAVKAIKSTGYDPVMRLDHLTEATMDGGRPTRVGGYALEQDNPYAELDQLYLSILKDDFSSENEIKLSNLRSILGLLAVTYEPLTVTTIAEILSLTINTISATLQLLHAVLLVPHNQLEETTIRFHHSSFLDFLADARRCGDPSFHIDMSEHHFNVARYCFHLMDGCNRTKPKNVCDLPRYTRNEQLSVADRDRHITRATKYPCRHWADHLLADRNRNERLATTGGLLISFVKTKQLWWFEILSLIQELQVATKALDSVYAWISSIDPGRIAKYGPLVQCIYESKHFVSFAFDAIRESAVHIYHSALPFSPINSMYRQIAASLLATEAKLILGASETWTYGFGDIHSTTQTTFARFSLNGSLIVSGSEDKTVRIWSANESDGASSGILSLLEYPSVILAATFLPDDIYVVCYDEDGSLILWDWAQANICDRNTTAHETHGNFGQLFPSGSHRPLGFFSTHYREAHRWRLCYWEVLQESHEDVGQPDSKSDDPTNRRLHLFAEGTLPRIGGYGVTRIYHQPSSNPGVSTVIAEFRDGQRSVASMIDPTISTAHDTTLQTLSFRSDPRKAAHPTQFKESYIGLERPCRQSDDGAWIMDEQDRQILWVPPMHRGWGRWWEKKLLLEGKSGRLTLIDFSHVDIHSDALF